MKKYFTVFLFIIITYLNISCSFAPPREEIDKKSNEIGLYEEWLMGLIAVKFLKLPLQNKSNNLSGLEIKFNLIIKKLHLNAVGLPFWREPYRPPIVIIYKTRKQNAFTLPGGFICLTTGLLSHIYKNAKKNGDQVMAAILAHELVHLYLEHPKRHYITLLLKDNIGRKYREMAEGIKAASGDFTNDYSKMLIKTIIKAKNAGTNGYQFEMEKEADEFAVLILKKAKYNPNGLLIALKLLKHHMGGVHGTYEERTKRVKQAIQLSK